MYGDVPFSANGFIIFSEPSKCVFSTGVNALTQSVWTPQLHLVVHFYLPSVILSRFSFIYHFLDSELCSNYDEPGFFNQ